LQLRRHVPSIPIITASIPRSNETRLCLRSPHTIANSHASQPEIRRAIDASIGTLASKIEFQCSFKNASAATLNAGEIQKEFLFNDAMMRANLF
jgi:hypothetical protein